MFFFIFIQNVGQSAKETKKQKIDVKEMIVAVYFKIPISRDLIDLPKQSIKYRKASIKI